MNILLSGLVAFWLVAGGILVPVSGWADEFNHPESISSILDWDQDGIYEFIDSCWGSPQGVSVNERGCIDLDEDGVRNADDFCPNTPFGALVDEQGCPYDRDDDWILDYFDACPDTPKGVLVNGDGCPMDSDWDRVPDYLDGCGRTPVDVAVDAKGCPVDADKDGVGDYQDSCPHTPVGAPVDKQGCWTLNLTILFEAGKSELNVMFHEPLDKVAELMRGGASKMELQGHTDNQIKESYFTGLDKRRAEAVAKYLVYRGVNPEALMVVTFGPDKPIGDNATPEGQAKNNRVELHPR